VTGAVTDSRIGIYGLCLAFSAALCVGQVLFKMAALGQDKDAFSFVRLLQSPWFFAAAGLYALTTVLWIYILTRLPLSLAYPFSLLGAAFVPLAAWLLFGEPLGVKVWGGLVLILAGLYVMYLS